MTYLGRGSAANRYAKWDGSKWVIGDVRLSGVQNYPVALANGSDNIWVGAPGGFGNLFCSAFVPTGDTEVSQGAFWPTQSPGGGGGGAVGIYNSAGVLLKRTGIIAHGLGITVAPWSVPTPLVLTGGNLYFMAIYSNMNGAQYLRFSPAATPPGGSTVGFNVPNSGALDPSGFPANVAGFFATLTALRFWSAAG